MQASVHTQESEAEQEGLFGVGIGRYGNAAHRRSVFHRESAERTTESSTGD